MIEESISNRDARMNESVEDEDESVETGDESVGAMDRTVQFYDTLLGLIIVTVLEYITQNTIMLCQFIHLKTDIQPFNRIVSLALSFSYFVIRYWYLVIIIYYPARMSTVMLKEHVIISVQLRLCQYNRRVKDHIWHASMVNMCYVLK